LYPARLDSGSGHNDRLDAIVWALTDLDLAGSPIDEPWAEAFARWVWPCVCGHQFDWEPGKRCPKCHTPAPATYDAPVRRDGG